MAIFLSGRGVNVNSLLNDELLGTPIAPIEQSEELLKFICVSQEHPTTDMLWFEGNETSTIVTYGGKPSVEILVPLPSFLAVLRQAKHQVITTVV